VWRRGLRACVRVYARVLVPPNLSLLVASMLRAGPTSNQRCCVPLSGSSDAKYYASRSPCGGSQLRDDVSPRGPRSQFSGPPGRVKGCSGGLGLTNPVSSLVTSSLSVRWSRGAALVAAAAALGRKPSALPLPLGVPG